MLYVSNIEQCSGVAMGGAEGAAAPPPRNVKKV